MSEPTALRVVAADVVAHIGTVPARPPLSAAERDRRSGLALRKLAVPTRYAAVTLENYALFGTPAQQATTKRAHDALARRVAEYPAWTASTCLMAFTGTTGAGKNRAAWAFCRAMIERHAIAARQLKVADLVREMRDGWNGGSTNERETLKYWRELDLLVINEVRARSFTGKVDQPLFEIIDDRMDWFRPTILINNDESLDDFFRLIGRDLTDRITGSDGGLIDFGQESFRQWAVTP